jgi:ADP-heptose:LPS heptosyltransferase
MKIIIIQIGRIGDAVLTTPLFRSLNESFPGIRIFLLTTKPNAQVLDKNPRLEKIFIFRKNPIFILFLILRLRLQHFDWWIDPKDHYSKLNSILAIICGVKNRVGLNVNSHKTYSISIPSDQDNLLLHAVERNFQSVSFLGITKPANIRPELFPDPEIQKTNMVRYNPCSKDTILLNISAYTPGRCWPIEKWAFVASACLERHYKVIVTFKPDDYHLANSLLKQVPGIMLFRSASIKYVVALMPQVGLVITPDTSIVHIAGAFNVPQIALFSKLESNLNKFRPLSDTCFVIQPKEDTGFKSISEKEVVDALGKIVLA